jgi:hypothetical protein
MSDSYYEVVDSGDARGERFTASDLVRSTWSAANQHAAPVSALLTRAMERCGQRDDTRLSRVSVDLLGGVPADGEFWVNAQVQRGGRQIELVGAEMLAPGPDGRPRPVAKATGWRMLALDTAALRHAPEPLLRPLSKAHSRDMTKNRDRNYVYSVDWRWLTSPLNDGPGEAWLRPTVDLVSGEAMTPLQRLFTVADCANGLGSRLDIRKWTFLNTDLVVHVHRVPEGEWTGIRAETSYGPDGIGATTGTLFDEKGSVAAIAQSVLIRPRPDRTGAKA